MTEKQVRINSGESLQTFFTRVVKEGIKSSLAQRALDEKEKQDKFGGGDDSGSDDLFGSDDSGDDDEEDTTSKTMDDEKEKLAHGNVEPKDIIERLNSIRSGKSFKDEKVAGAMEEYIGSLSKAEKVALLAFLKGIAQIVTGDVMGSEAEDPAEAPSDVKMKKGTGLQKTKTLTPNVIKTGGDEKKGSIENTQAPITARRR